MSLNWRSAAALAIAASIGWPLAASAQNPGYRISDAAIHIGDEPAAGDWSAPAAAASYSEAVGCTTCQQQCQCPQCCAAAAAEEVCEPWRLFCQKDCGWNLYGFASAGYMGNTESPADNSNGPVTFADRDWGQFNQFYAIAEKKADNGGCGFDWGGRIDLLYGSDYVYTQATGLELAQNGLPNMNVRADGNSSEYGLALPQFYAQVQYNNWDIKLGHFYTVLGYEVVPANGNFFYTHAYTMQYGEPFTHTGVLGAYKYSDTTTINLGFVNGSDHFDRIVDTGAGIVGFNWDGGNGLTLAFNFFFSPNEFIFFGDNATDPDTSFPLSNRNVYSLVVSKTFGCCNEWQYVLQHDLGWQNDANGEIGAAGQGGAEWYGINQYLFYTINDCWKAGFRVEWFRDDDGARVTGLRNPDNAIFGSNFAGNFYEMSAGMNWTPSANLTVRPEIRYDWFDGVPLGAAAGPYQNGAGSDQLLLGLDVVYLW